MPGAGSARRAKPLQARGEAGWPTPLPAIAILRTAKRARNNKNANPKIQIPRKIQKRGRNKPCRPKLPPRNRWQPSPKRRAAGRQAANAAAKRLSPSRKQNRSNMLSPGRNPRKRRKNRKRRNLPLWPNRLKQPPRRKCRKRRKYHRQYRQRLGRHPGGGDLFLLLRQLRDGGGAHPGHVRGGPV